MTRRKRMGLVVFALAAVLLLAGAAAVVLRPISIGRGLADLVLSARGYRTRTIETPSGGLNIIERPGEGPPVVFVHGFLAEARVWSFSMLRLARARSVLAIDLPGCGLSDPPPAPPNIGSLTRAVAAAMDETGLKKAALVGNSMGGWISLQLALDRPDLVSSLVLVDSAGIKFDPPADFILVPRDPEEFEAAWPWIHHHLRCPPRFVLRDILRLRDLPDARALLTNMETGAELVDSRLGEIHVPALVLWGGEDRLIPKEVGHRIAAAIPGAGYREIPSCGHVPQVECAKPFTEILEQFLDAGTP